MESDILEAIERRLAPLAFPYELQTIVFVPAIEMSPGEGLAIFLLLGCKMH